MQAIVNNKTFDIEFSEGEVLINQDAKQLDISQRSPHALSIILDGRQVDAFVENMDRENKTVTLQINQKSYTVELKDKMDLLLKEMGLEGLNEKKLEDLKSPMPGLILKVLVQPGQPVSKGDTLMILEAMKMENSLKASADAIVDTIMVSEKQVVEKGDKLITFTK